MKKDCYIYDLDNMQRVEGVIKQYKLNSDEEMIKKIKEVINNI